MSSRPIFTPHSVITNASMAGDVTSAVTVIQNLSMLSYDISWTGTAPIGEIVVEVSNTYKQNQDGTVKAAGNWTALVLSSATPVTGSTGVGFIDIDSVASYAIRIRYVRASGTGVLNATINGKVA